MIELIERKKYPEDEILTDVFAGSLRAAGINVHLMTGPTCPLSMADGKLSINSMLNKFEDIDYARRAIIGAKPLIVFLYKVTKSYDENGASYTIRYNYIVNDSIFERNIKNETN